MQLRNCKIRVPATSANIGPGFDTLGVAINRYLYLKVNVTARSFDSKVNWTLTYEPEIKGIQTVEDNLIIKVASFVYQKECQANLFEMNCHFDLTVQSQIPIRRGLGSSSSAIVAGILLANEIGSFNLNKQSIIEYALKFEGHPDNLAPCIYGDVVASVQSGSPLFFKLHWPEKLCLVTVIPDQLEVKTEAARKCLPDFYPKEDVIFNLQRVAGLVAFFSRPREEEEFDQLSTLLEDRLHQPYRAHLIPGFEEILSIPCVYISGSGSTIMALSRESEKDCFGSNIASILASKGIKATIAFHKVDRDGAVVVK